MKIGELARAAQCTVETVRYYEREGLLPPPERTAANYRSYDDSHLARLRFIRNCRALDMSHNEIHSLLAALQYPGADCGAVNAVLDEHIAHVDTRIEELMSLKGQLLALRSSCRSQSSVDACGILRGLNETHLDGRAVRNTHLG